MKFRFSLIRVEQLFYSKHIIYLRLFQKLFGSDAGQQLGIHLALSETLKGLWEMFTFWQSKWLK